MVAFKLTVPFIRTGARESSSWPGVHSTSRPNTFLQTTSANLEFFCLTPSGGPYIFYRRDKTVTWIVSTAFIAAARLTGYRFISGSLRCLTSGDTRIRTHPLLTGVYLTD